MVENVHVDTHVCMYGFQSSEFFFLYVSCGSFLILSDDMEMYTTCIYSLYMHILTALIPCHIPTFHGHVWIVVCSTGIWLDVDFLWACVHTSMFIMLAF